MKGWFCFPIWGLEMADNGFGLENPIFGDATLVSPAFLKHQSPQDPRARAMFAGGGLREILEQSPDQSVGPAAVDRLIDIPPGAFIAVRRKKLEDAQRYSETIRAFLTATAVLTSGQPKGFSTSPLPLHWAAIPSAVRLSAQGELQIDYKIAINNFIYHEPIQVSHRHLSESWKHGSPVHGTWSISKEKPFAKVLVGDANSLTSLQLRIRDAASTLARAMESTDMAVSTLFGVVAIESLLRSGASDFKEMEQLTSCIFDSPAGPSEIARLFANRHKVAHEAKSPQGQREHSLEIATAWAFIYLAAIASDDIVSVDEFLEHLRGRVLARRVAKQLREKGKNDLAEAVEQAATLIAKKARKK